MQYQILTLLFSATALAGPVAQVTTITYTEPNAALVYDSEIDDITVSYPSWYESIMETAIPTTWENEFLDDATFAESVDEAELLGTMPAWWSSLPSDAKYVYTSEDAVLASEMSTVPWPSTITGTTVVVYTFTPYPELVSDIEAASSSKAKSTANGTSAASGAAQTSTSTAGAAGPTGAIAMSIAGVVGVLGLAIAL
ncbi:hypothetical protein N7478_012266 [Penicillium angulare]|uniref:uncharacterized protein n=1 Tax=Penicillium angulare TaxID=116970 RepID=UPI002541742B|nr:uncharacterized protein N7478_012266 [Penicillium angulare]KAJ5259285.1 hypothetical protein N7478_012266 [Penicillium angulare]